MSRSFAVAVGLSCFGLAVAALPARASLSVSAAVGGAPAGASYANFDTLPLGDAGGNSGGMTVAFAPDGQAVRGSLTDRYAAPLLSNGNGSLFGDPGNGSDSTTYLTTGLGSVTLGLPGQETYLGLLWGSVDAYNTLSLYNGTLLVGRLTGTDVTAGANGDQGIDGTYYVNIASTQGFDRVVASSSQYTFEFDNVAYGRTAVPEPSTLVLFVAILMGLGLSRRRPARQPDGLRPR